MTLGPRIRLWARQAPRAQVVAAALVALAVVGALAVSAVPQDTTGTVAAGSNQPFYPGLAADPGTAGLAHPPPGGDGRSDAPTSGRPAGRAAIAAGGGPAAPGGEFTTGNSGPLAARVGVGPSGGKRDVRSSAPIGVPYGGGPGAGAGPGRGRDGGPGADGTGGAGSGGPGPADSGHGPGRGAGPVVRTASDQGVTVDTIKVGFLLPSFANLDAAGFAFGQRQDREAFIKAYVDDLNRTGGIHGRRVVHTVVKSDPFSAAAARQSCIKLTTDEKVFAVMNSGGALGSNVVCYAEAKVPNIFATAQTVSEAQYRKHGGYLAAMGASGTRVLLNWALFALDSGVIGPGKGKLGILSDECPPDPEMIDQDFKPFLKQKGVDVVEARVSCDIGLAQQQVPGAVLQMRQAGVTQVFFAVLFPSAQSFMQQAEAQNYEPRYHVSDFWGLATDFSTKSFPGSAFDRAQSITFTHSGEDAAGLPLSAPVQRCSEILTDAGLPGITNQMGADAEAVVLCDALNLWAQAARRAPVNLTRADWTQALAALGAFAPAFPEAATFGPGKFNGGDSYARIEWRRECSCWFQLSRHRPARL